MSKDLRDRTNKWIFFMPMNNINGSLTLDN